MLRLLCSLLGMIVLLAGCANRSQAPAASVPVAGDTINYPRPGDLVRLQIWREPDLSGEFLVDETGVVVFPQIGPTRVSRETPESLRAKLINAYRPYLTHGAIDVTLLRRVQVLGAVRNPGLYPVDPTMTIGDALALAGGAETDGNPNEMELIRGGRRVSVKLAQGTRIGDLRIRSGDQLFVPERSWIARNPAIVTAALGATVSIVIAVLRTR